MNTVLLAALMTFYCFIFLLALWLSVGSIQRHQRRMVNRIRRELQEELRFHRDSLLAHMRLEQATHRQP